jgi:hypothetical protein
MFLVFPVIPGAVETPRWQPVFHHHRLSGHLLIIAFNIIKGYKSCSTGQVLHNDPMVPELIGVKGMQGLPELMQYEIGNINYIINGTHAYGQQPFLQPAGGLTHRTVTDADAGITGT